ncbi:SDR family oxidoreductase [Chengkuizengella axinellae]|uniref:SDR family oxidoreductase n=1 Tax=Chengkuizengella axinellae TaxID=3064388 RepID=A0ABT9IY47_9BACL|nr:SDR family oxidoreductase [Chengkuizengella sp. 2205SS18-9]MDP5274285.1 SDR family oxidoreductase [Chengkuizengella sp. 2205SS18-9]
MKNDRVALVIGASQGIGKSIAIALAENGYHLILIARRKEKLEQVLETVNEINNSKLNMCIPVDISNQDNRNHVFRTVVKKYDRLDILINNVPGGSPDEFLNSQNDKMIETFTQKAITYIDCMKQSYEWMEKNNYGRIINLVGNLWKEPGKNMFTNSLINAAIINASKNISIQLAPKGITVNCVNPGFIKTDRYHHYIHRLMTDGNMGVEEAERIVTEQIPSKRVGTSEEVASLVMHLVSESGSYITGQQISVDGGALKSI